MSENLEMQNGTDFEIRRLAPDDLNGLLTFFTSLPKSDRKYLRIDVTDRKVVQQRVSDALANKDIRLVALHGGRIIASGALEFSRSDWRKAQAELRLIVAREYQRRGLGLMLARELYHQAAENGVKTIVAKMMKPQASARNLVEKLGFHEEAVIPDYVMDQFGRLQDMVVMTCDMKDFWRELEHATRSSDWRRCR